MSLALSWLATLLRIYAGFAGRARQVPEPLSLYEFEGCPHCRLTREALSELGLTHTVYPCPKGGKRFRPRVESEGGKAQFPWFHDPSAGVRMYESADIAFYLFRRYGNGVPLWWWLTPIHRYFSILATLPRMAQGVMARPVPQGEKKVRLTGAERHPGVRLVRERLCEMEWCYECVPASGEPVLNIDGEEIRGSTAILKALRRQ